MRRNQKNVTEDDFIMLPTVDFCFKELMQNENIRKGIVAALLKLRPEDVLSWKNVCGSDQRRRQL